MWLSPIVFKALKRHFLVFDQFLQTQQRSSFARFSEIWKFQFENLPSYELRYELL